MTGEERKLTVGQAQVLMEAAMREGFEIGWRVAHEEIAEYLLTQGATPETCKAFAQTPAPPLTVHAVPVGPGEIPKVEVPGTRPPRAD